ncbi:hypothetical protein GCM10010507_01710 [Streptomyces cinnamoneus]|uniref:Uncharacterized protein n=1 Tax=Streptomyces cinnamoneus TaxID=53446 RepID=A0A918TBL5_STRCJ|nr:hypothetical protein GCM10010507_01710 [Streptomyces cinnamoneus]
MAVALRGRDRGMAAELLRSGRQEAAQNLHPERELRQYVPHDFRRALMRFSVTALKRFSGRQPCAAGRR